jgi:hypothetical protein
MADVTIFPGWEQKSKFSVGHIPIEIYRSTASGVQVGRTHTYSACITQRVHHCTFSVSTPILQVVIAQVEGPLVNAFLVVPTECHTDDGNL